MEEPDVEQVGHLYHVVFTSLRDRSTMLREKGEYRDR